MNTTFYQIEIFILQIVKPKSAFVIVDVQNDFISGSLAIKNCAAKQDGEDVGYGIISFKIMILKT